MLKKKTPLLVGLLVIVGIAAFLLTFGSLDKGIDLQNAYRVDAVFDDATGLVEKSRVMLSGIPVGEIDRIALDEADPSRARVTMLLEGRIKLREGVRDEASGEWVNGATASRLQASLLGDYYISISPGVAGPVIPAGGEIHIVITESGLSAVLKQMEKSTEVIFPKLEKITDDVAAITGSLREGMGGEDGERSIREIRTNIEQASKDVAAMTADVRSFVADTLNQNEGRINSIVGNVEAASADIRAVADTLDRRLDGILVNVADISADVRGFVGKQVAEGAEGTEGTLAHTLKKIDASVATLEGTLESAKAVVAGVERGEGTVGRLLTDSKLIDDVEGIVEDVKGVTDSIGRLQVKVEFRSEYQVGQTALKNYLNFSLYPKPDKFYFFQVVSDPQGLVTTKQRVITSNDPTLPPVLVQDEVVTESKLKFSAQFGKRWHFLSFRYGILESTGGLGLDLDLLEDALRMKVDLFDFGRDDWPRLRVLAAWEFLRHLYVAAGLDDALNKERRDWFVGLGVSFTDDDIKGILPFAPTSF